LSPTVSVHRQQRLYDYLLQRIPEKGPEDFLPFHPLDDRAYQRLLVIFRRLHTYLLGLSRSDQGHKYYVTIGQLWMRGTPLPVIIQRSHEFKIRRHPGASLATTTGMFWVRSRTPCVSSTFVSLVVTTLSFNMRFRSLGIHNSCQGSLNYPFT
jgi:hypothetical protein